MSRGLPEQRCALQRRPNHGRLVRGDRTRLDGVVLHFPSAPTRPSVFSSVFVAAGGKYANSSDVPSPPLVTITERGSPVCSMSRPARWPSSLLSFIENVDAAPSSSARMRSERVLPSAVAFHAYEPSSSAASAAVSGGTSLASSSGCALRMRYDASACARFLSGKHWPPCMPSGPSPAMTASQTADAPVVSVPSTTNAIFHDSPARALPSELRPQ